MVTGVVAVIGLVPSGTPCCIRICIRILVVFGASINMSPGLGALNISNIVCFYFRSLSILKKCPNH